MLSSHRLVSACLASIAVLVATARISHAQSQDCFYQGEPCDDMAPECDRFCAGETLPWVPVETEDGVKVAYPVSPGDPIAAQALGGLDAAVELASPTATHAPTPQDLYSVLPGDLNLLLINETLRNLSQDLGYGTPPAVPPRASPAIAVDQGVERDHENTGDARGYDTGGRLSDPVDPITGEFVVENTDLQLPSFGVPFVLRRVYRSRVDLDGPLGHGWDHVYNQRIVDEPPWFAGPLPGPLPLPDDRPGCGPVVVLATGDATSLRFREQARSVDPSGGETVLYGSPASRLALTGHDDGEAVTWQLRTQEGDVRHFDDRGVLVRWVDGNGVGLTLQWQETVRGLAPSVVTDSVGRIITFEYDGAGRLTKVAEPVSGLEASYGYGPTGTLDRATRADGRTETYGYDVLGRERGDWVAEPLLHASCARSCAVSSSSCDAGGVCDGPVADAMAACGAACGQCSTECREGCSSLCDTECRGCRSSCQAMCDSTEQRAAIDAECDRLWTSTGAKEACEECDEVCRQVADTPCYLFGNCSVNHTAEPGPDETSAYCYAEGWGGELWSDVLQDSLHLFQWAGAAIVDGVQCLISLVWGDCDDDQMQGAWEAACDYNATQCCIDGEHCADLSCNVGVECEDSCEATWRGDPMGTGCLAPVPSVLTAGGVPPVMGTQEYADALADPYIGSADAWAANNGCEPKVRQHCVDGCNSQCRNGGTFPDATGQLVEVEGCIPACEGECGDHCDTVCHVNDCAAYCEQQDFAGMCESSCTDACVDAAHAAGDDPGPKYGHPADLDYNLVRIYDGAGNLWLENEYGQDVRSPDFDTVVHQRYGDFTAEMSHVDLRAHAEGLGLVPDPATMALVDDLDSYEKVHICPRNCDTAAPDLRDVLVPLGDTVLVFEGGVAGGERDRAGLAVQATLLPRGAIPPTIVRFRRQGDGVVALLTPRAYTGPLARARGKIDITLPQGTASLAVGGTTWAVNGEPAAIDALAQLGELTILSDASGVRVHAGHAAAVLAIAAGSCDRPFHVERTADDRIRLSPSNACTGDLWLAPLASAAPATLGLDWLQKGNPAITSSQLHPTVLVPERLGAVWRSWGDGTYTREKPASAIGDKRAADLAAATFSKVPMLSAPTAASLDDPFYVFHHAIAGIEMPPWDGPFAPTDNAPPNWSPPCDPDRPDPAIRGVGALMPGPVPASATVVTDLHERRWTLYADDRGRMIRTVNHATGAVWSFQHDPAGQLVGVEAPDRARQCFTYDAVGNLVERVDLPAPSSLPTLDPVRHRVSYQMHPSRTVAVWDPRDPTAALARYEYDAAGNLTRTLDAAGLPTTITRVGGDGPDRAQPAQVIDPSGAVQRLTWDVDTGTLHTHTIDATGAQLRSEVVADEAGRPVWSQGPLGAIQTWSWDGPFLAASGYEADGFTGTTAYGYDDDGKLSTVLDGQRQTTLRHDVIGSLIDQRVTALDGSADEQVRCQALAPGGRVLEAVTAEGHRTRYAYDGEGRVTSIEAGDLGPSPGTWDDACPDHAPGPSVSGTVARFGYDVAGRLAWMEDERGVRSEVTVDGFGRPVIVHGPDGTTARRGFDALGNVTWEAVFAPGAAAAYGPPTFGQPGLLAASQWFYDARGEVTERRDWHFDASGAPIGDGLSITRFARDDVARTFSMTDDNGATTTVVRDGAGRVVEVRLPDGSSIRTTVSEGGRRVERRATVAGIPQTSVTKLTSWGQPWQSAVVAAGTELVTGTVGFDARLRPVRAIAESGAETSTHYDAFDRPVLITSVPGETVTIEWDRDGRVRARHGDDGAGTVASWAFEVDALGRTWRQRDPRGGVSEVEFEGLSSLPFLATDPSGITSTFAWSSTGQMIGMVADAPGVTPDVQLRWTHDPLGRVTKAVRDDGLDGDDAVSWFVHDSLGNVTSESDSSFGPGATRTHAHDGVGLPVSSVLGARTVGRRFDVMGRLTAVVVDNEPSATATFNYLPGPGGPTLRTLKNGVKTSYGRDLLGRIDQITELTPSGGTLARGAWELPLDGVPRTASLLQVGSTFHSAFGVDTAGRVAGERHGLATAPPALAPTASFAAASAAIDPQVNNAQSIRYALTGRSSWDTRTAAGATTTYKRDALDAYTTIGTASPTYDAGGNLLQDGASTFAYDALGQLAEVDVGGHRRRYQRDALGRIIAETDLSSGQTTRFAYDGLRRTFRKAPDGLVDVTIEGAGLDEPLVTIQQGGARRYYHQDRLGSISLVTGETGQALEWYRYSAYGEPTIRNALGSTIPASAIGNRLGFQGQAHDWATGLVDMRARVYRPAWGRFLTRDPLGLAAGPNLYGFVDASPLSFIDPLGLEKQSKQSGFDCPAGCHDNSTRWLGDPLGTRLEPYTNFHRVDATLAYYGEEPTAFERDLAAGDVRYFDSPGTEVTRVQPYVRRWSEPGGVSVETVVGWRTWNPGLGEQSFDRDGNPMTPFNPTNGTVAEPDIEPDTLWSVGALGKSALNGLTRPGLWRGLQASVAGGAGGQTGTAGARNAIRNHIEDDIGEPLAGYEYFLHGTRADIAERFTLDPAKSLFTTTESRVARMFAERTVAKAGFGEVGGVALVLPVEAVKRLRATGALTVRPISDMPNILEWVFSPAAFATLNREGHLITLPRGAL